jgi:hypothetical protein
MELLLQLTQLWEAALAGLGVHQAAIHRHLEAATAAGNEAQTLDQVAVLVKKLLRRPGGSKEIVSRHAVLDLNGQLLVLGHLAPPLGFVAKRPTVPILGPRPACFKRGKGRPCATDV